MKIELLFSASVLTCVLAGPARLGCGETLTYTATNQCGVGYGGSWVDCAAGPTAVPTFDVPDCGPNPPEIYPDYTMTTTTSYDAPITPAPYPEVPTSNATGYNTTSCRSLMICVDAIKTCGTETYMYGGCYNHCSPTSFEEPPCTLPPVSKSSTTPVPSTADSDGPPPTPTSRPHLGICDEYPFRCAPGGW